MDLDARFDDLVATLGGFHRAWLVHLGLELGLFDRLRAAGPAGMRPADLAAATATDPAAIAVWAWAADAHDLALLDDGRLVLDEAVASILLDDQRPEYLGGQFVHAVTASMDWEGLAEFFRTGQPVRSRPDRYRRAIERLTVQDIAVFFQEALAALPQLTSELARGGRVLDVHCGGGRWLIAMARRFPLLELVGVEWEADSAARARENVASSGLETRITIEQRDEVDPAALGSPFDLVYYQYALHQLADPAGSLRAAWAATASGGRIAVLDWPLPAGPEESRTRHGELIAGVHLDEIFQGTGLRTRDGFAAWFADAGLPAPEVIDLPSGATLFIVTRTS